MSLNTNLRPGSRIGGRARSLAALGGIALLAAVALAGCTSDAEPNNYGKTTQATDDGAQPTSGSNYEQEYASWRHNLAQCMRDGGIDVKDPSPRETMSLDGYDQELVQTTMKSCTEKVGKPPVDENAPSPEELNKQQLTFARCMRDAGYDWKDPEADPGNGSSAGVKAIKISDYDMEDMNKCSDKAGFERMGAE